MTTPNERDRFEAWAKDTMSLVKEPGGYKEATTHHAWRAWQATLTREQREGVPERKVGCEGSDGLLRVHAESETCDVCKPKQEAPGSVATVCLRGDTYAHGLMTELQVQHAEGVEFPIGTKFYTTPQPGDGWRPIAEAPKDGRYVLLVHETSGGRPYAGMWNYDDKQWADERGCIRVPTHWMPLPAAPSAATKRRAAALALLDSQPAGVDESTWREGWAFAYSGTRLYGDDGELQDNSEQPFIDWRRDSATEILAKIRERANRKIAALGGGGGGE